MAYVVVLVTGVFDVLHRGHIELLKAARLLGDRLVVGINSDTSTAKLKPGRPIFAEEDRAEMLRCLRPVSQVTIFDEADARGCILRVNPQIYVKGGDYDMTRIPEAAACRAVGAKAVALPFLRGYSTTRTLELLA